MNCENRIGYAVIGEDREPGYLATITHVDVVPAGDGWPADPFTLREQDGWLLGRGVMDDKGPSVLCLYALKYLKDAGVPLRYPIRALLGSNEETHMHDLEYYQEHHPAPLFCISPDADFPLICGEKGIYHGRLISRHLPVNVLEISGGVAANAVPAKATARVRAERLTGTDAVTAEELEPGIWALSAAGISGHASTPEGTVNAIGLLVDYLLEHNIPDAGERPYFELIARLLRVTDGSLLGLQSSDDFFTPLTAVGGKITTGPDGRISQTIDCRYGLSMSGERITGLLREASGVFADVIAGFPTESEADFNQTVQFIRAQKLAGLHVFSYSARPGTQAALLPQLPAGEIKRRAEVLRTLDKELRLAFAASLVGTEQTVLVEEHKNGRLCGITANFQQVLLENAPTGLHGLARVSITRAEGPLCVGTFEEKAAKTNPTCAA